MTTATLIIDSPIGNLLVTASDGALTGLLMEPFDVPDSTRRRDPALTAARKQLDGYFAGKRTSFDVPLSPGGTPFQADVWRTLCDVPYGETITYAELARRVGRPGHFRAVGSANGRNPISIIIPCHRIVGSDGSLTGYGGGIERKRWLLDHERR